jgi:hypothetical protein
MLPGLPEGLPSEAPLQEDPQREDVWTKGTDLDEGHGFSRAVKPF